MAKYNVAWIIRVHFLRQIRKMGIERLKLDITSKSAFMESFPDMKEWTKRGLAACVRQYVCSMFFLGGASRIIKHISWSSFCLCWVLLVFPGPNSFLDVLASVLLLDRICGTKSVGDSS